MTHQDSDSSFYDSTCRIHTHQEVIDHQNLQNYSGNSRYPLIQANRHAEKNKFDDIKLINSKLIDRKQSIKETNLDEIIYEKESIAKNIKEILNSRNNSTSLKFSKTKQLYELLKRKLNKKPLNNKNNSLAISDLEYPF